jgi:NAD(P)-dependent dehydrogenase (short-subunit alcohol dehydrogenase family)
MTTATTVSPTLREPQLLGQTVVAIGGSSGIGLETARRARAEGADVLLTGRNPERLQHAALEPTRPGAETGRLAARMGASMSSCHPQAARAAAPIHVTTIRSCPLT